MNQPHGITSSSTVCTSLTSTALQLDYSRNDVQRGCVKSSMELTLWNADCGRVLEYSRNDVQRGCVKSSMELTLWNTDCGRVLEYSRNDVQ